MLKICGQPLFCNQLAFWLYLSISGSLWLAVRLTLALSDSLRLSLAFYCSPNLLTKSLLCSQGSRSARSSATALLDFLQVCLLVLLPASYLSAIHKIVSCHRCLSDSFEKYIATPNVSLILKLKCLIQINRIKKYEFEMYNAMDHVITLTDEDRLSILNYAPQLPVSVVPPGIDLIDLNNTKIAKKPDFPLLMMCGYFADKSNRDAAIWFIQNIWPIIYKKNKKVKCWFIGKGINKEMINIASNKSGITLIADIENLRPYRKAASVFINPMRLGSGLRIKILEAMGAGLPVVTTSLGAAGIPAQNGVNCLISDTPSEFAESVLWLLKDKNLSVKIGNNAKNMVERKYEINQCINQLESIINDTIKI